MLEVGLLQELRAGKSMLLTPSVPVGFAYETEENSPDNEYFLPTINISSTNNVKNTKMQLNSQISLSKNIIKVFRITDENNYDLQNDAFDPDCYDTFVGVYFKTVKNTFVYILCGRVSFYR